MATPAAILSILVEANTDKAQRNIKRVNETLDQIAKKRVVAEVGVDVNKTELTTLKKELDKLGTKSSSPKIKIDGTAKALADIKAINTELKKFSGKTYKSTVKVVTKGIAKTDVELEKVNVEARDKTKKITVKTNMSLIGRIVSAFRGLDSQMKNVNQDSNLLTRSLGGLRAAFGGGSGGGSSWTDQAALSFKEWAIILISALPVIIDLTAALGALAASAGAAAAGVGALAVGGAGAAGVGIAGIASIAIPAITSLKNLITAMNAMHQAQATGAQTAGRAQQAAAQAIKTANQQITSANQGLTAAEQQLTAAQQNENQAQVALTLARKDATRQLQDMSRAALESGLAEQGARLSLADAQKNLQQLEASGTASALDLQNAILQVKLAQANLTDTTIAAHRAQQDNQAAQQKGVQGMPQVVAAQHSLRDATRAVSTAQDGVTKATQAVQKAVQNLAYRQSRANTTLKAGSTQMAALRYQMRKAGPAAVAFAKSLMHLKRRWLDLTLSGRNDFFGMLRDGLRRVNRLLPLFARSANSSIGALRKGFDIFLRQAAGPEFKHFINVMTVTFKRAMPPLADALGRIAKILERIAIAAAPEVIKMVKAFDGMIQNWDKATSNAASLKDTIHGLVQNTWAWIHLIKAAGQLIVAVLVPGINTGKKAVRGLTGTLHGWTDWVKSHPTEIRDFFKQGLETTKQLFAIIIPLIHQLFVMGEAMRPLANAFLDLSKWLLSLHLGKINALEAIIAMIVSFKLAKWAVGVGEAFRLIPPAAAKAAPAIEAEGAAVGTGYASKLGSALKKAIPYAFAAFAIGNVISSAVKGDTKGALAKTGGALAGALVGYMVGGVPGAMVGSGIGSVLGGLLGKALNKSVAHLGLGHIEAKLEREIKAGAKAEKKASKAIKDSADIVQRARQKEHKATKKLRDLEDKRAADLKKYGPLSRQVAGDDNAIARARNREANKTQDLKKAEHLHGDVLKANKVLIAHQLVLDNQRVDNLKKIVKKAKEQFDQDRSNKDSAQKLVTATTNLNKAQVGLGKENVHAINVLGPGMAKQLQQQGKKAAEAANNYLHFKNQMHNWGTGTTISTNQAISNEKRLRRDQQKTIEQLHRLKGETDAAWRARQRLARVAGPATAIPGNKKPPHKQLGGLVGTVPGTSSGDNHTLSINGVPIAKVESKEGIFVGNRTMTQQVATANQQIPRRADGGYVDVWGQGMAHLAAGGEVGKAKNPLPHLRYTLGHEDALNKLIAKIKGMDVPPRIADPITFFTKITEAADELATRASSLDFTNPDTGDVTLGLAQGHPEVYWLMQELPNLGQLRNSLINGVDYLKTLKQKLQDQLDAARAKLVELKKTLKQLQTEQQNAAHQLATDSNYLTYLQKHYPGKNPGPKTGIPQTKDRVAADKVRVNDLNDKIKAQTSLISTLTGKVIPDYTTQLTNTASSSTDFSSALSDTQGPSPPSSLKVLPNLPAVGELGGQILQVQLRLNELTGITGRIPHEPPPDLPPDGGGVLDNDQLIALLEQQLQEAQQKLVVSQLQLPVFQDFFDKLPFAGFFAKGGSIPAGAWGIAGERGPETVVGPATVVPSVPGTDVHMHFANGMEWMRDFVSVEVGKKVSKDIGSSRRRA